jgi:hypothetical protein
LKLGEKMHHQSNRQRLDLKELCIGTFWFEGASMEKSELASIEKI